MVGLISSLCSPSAQVAFLPNKDYPRSASLLEEVWKTRQACFLAKSICFLEFMPLQCKETGFADCYDEFIKLSPEMRRELVEDPVFRIWLKQAAKTSFSSPRFDLTINPQPVESLKDFTRIFTQFFDTCRSSNTLLVGESSIQVRRFDVDPLIAQASPPTYIFPRKEDQDSIESATAFKLDFVTKVLISALDRIAHTFPGAYQDFGKFVKIIINVPNVEFRSCSAERYSGIIFISCHDTCLLGYEESLLHEYAHQILYNIMELDKVITADGNNADKFKLPWSGRERDYYGYFHAFFIYILLAQYLDAVRRGDGQLAESANTRFMDIVDGLSKAVTFFESVDRFTPMGRQLFSTLKMDIGRLKEV